MEPYSATQTGKTNIRHIDEYWSLFSARTCQHWVTAPASFKQGKSLTTIAHTLPAGRPAGCRSLFILLAGTTLATLPQRSPLKPVNLQVIQRRPARRHKQPACTTLEIKNTG